MNVFKNGRLYWTRVPRSDRRLKRVSTGTADRKTAQAIGRMVDTFRDRGRTDILDAAVAGRVRLLGLYAEYRDDQTMTATTSSLDDRDLCPLVCDWHRDLQNRGTKSADRYVSQTRVLIGADRPYPASWFGRRAISEHLTNLPVSRSTRNRHRSALMQFGNWLVEREVMESNPVRDVRASPENPPRTIHYSADEVRALVGALPAPFQALEAVMAGTGMEWCAVARLRRRDIDVARRTIRAHGSKNMWRNRICYITESWTIPIIEAHVSSLTSDALVFAAVKHDRALDVHERACATLGLTRTTLHDHRHSYAVNALKKGMPPHLVASQLGHKDATLVHKVYGKFVPRSQDFEKYMAAD